MAISFGKWPAARRNPFARGLRHILPAMEPSVNPSIPFRQRMAGVLLAFALPASAQLDLGNMSLRTVRAADAGIVALPRFDTVALDVQVEAGVARTRATLVWTATSGAKALFRWRCQAPEPETTFVSERSWLDYYDARLHHDTIQTYWLYSWAGGKRVDSTLASFTKRVTSCRVDSIVYRESKLDSLELSAWFALPIDAAVTDLDLWVGDQKQSAWIMDRSKAAAQYNSIVGVRQDPALLETWGGGSYSLRVFPQTTGQTRRLEIEFVQAWRAGMALPVSYARAPSHQISVWSESHDTTFERKGQSPGKLVISLASLDGAPVSVDMGSLGSLSAGATRVKRVFKAPEAFFAKASGNPGSVWSAVRDGRPAFGAHLTLRGSDFTVAPIPRDRLVVLEASLHSERARRLALLALIHYGSTVGHRVDLLWRDADGSLKRLWGTPRSFTAEAALDAVAALKSWTPASANDPQTTLRRLLDTDSGKVVVLLSDASSPTFTETPPVRPLAADSAVWNAYSNAYNAWNRRYQAFYQNMRDTWKTLGDSLDRKNMKLFGWWRDGYIANASEVTGGYGFGDLQWGTWSWWRTGDSLVVPELFGGSRRGWSEGFQGMTIAHSGLAVDSFAHDLGSGSQYWGWDGPVIARPFVLLARTATVTDFAAARAAAVPLPESLAVTIAGRQSNGGALTLGVQGHWGGLKVKASRTIQVPAIGGEAGASLWAYEYTRSLQPWIWSFDSVTNAVRRIGRDYRVATTATSFLALEPGMIPFDSLGGQGNEAKVGDASVSRVAAYSVADGAVAGSTGDILLDSMSLESLLAGRVLATSRRAEALRKPLRLSTTDGLTIHALASTESPRVRILDLQGRQLAAPTMNPSALGWSANWRPDRTTFVVVQMVQDGKVLTERVLVRP